MASWFDIAKDTPVPLGKEYPMFNRFSIETSGFCNRRCSFCPQSTENRVVKQKLMEIELVESIVDQIRAMDEGYRGIIELFLLNEPTVDKRLREVARLVRRQLPKCTAYVTTNADLIRTVDDLASYFESGINVLNMNIYDSGEEQARRLHQLAADAFAAGVAEPTEHKYQKHPPRGAFLYVTDMRVDRPDSVVKSVDAWYARSESDRGHVTARQKHCARPSRHMVVMHDGRVPVCCSIDPLSPNVKIVGDARTQTIKEIWNGEEMFRYRYMLQQKHRRADPCHNCNATMAYSHVVRHVTAPPETIERWEREYLPFKPHDASELEQFRGECANSGKPVELFEINSAISRK